jgi:TPR repeat protein
LAEAVRYYRLAAEQSRYAEAQCSLGMCYANGKGVAQDWSEAVRYYRLAAEQGDAKAQSHLGTCYLEGEGVAQDRAEAVRYYRLAAEQGFAYAQCNLGACLELGLGVAQDWAEAVRYYLLATAQADALSSEDFARATAACHRIACSREVASTCCLGCGARRKLKKCAKCHVARFCSSECVARAWPAHRPNCKLWRNHA